MLIVRIVSARRRDTLGATVPIIGKHIPWNHVSLVAIALGAALIALLLGLAVAGCAKVSTSSGTGGTTGSGTGGRAGIPASDAGTSDRATTDGTTADNAGAVDTYVAPDLITADVPPMGAADAACATQSAMAETVPLDLYVMMDSSGSMTGATSAGPTKWAAVRTALTTFFNDPRSAGLGVGLQYFPQIQTGVPAVCTTEAICGAFGPCQKVAANTCYGLLTTQIVLCTTAADCRSGETCIPLGYCPVSAGSCAPMGSLCPLGDICGPPAGICRGRDRCDIPTYATPAVAIAALPGAAPALVSSLTMHEPDGATPTGPAVAGAIQAAQAHAAANPNHKLAVLLVTDGLPTECTPLDVPAIAALAAAGASGTPAVPTFVIGVFAPDEAAAATSNLNLLAQQGGTGTAVVINTNQNVTEALQTALGQIRTTAVACEYKIPPPTGGPIDFQKVNVQFTAANGTVTTIGYVGSKAACDPTRGGWYYDVDPATGKTPTSIIACDATCTQFRADAAARVSIVLGCATVVIM